MTPAHEDCAWLTLIVYHTSVADFHHVKTTTLEKSGNGSQTAGLVMQLIHGIANDVVIWAVGPHHYAELQRL